MEEKISLTPKKRVWKDHGEPCQDDKRHKKKRIEKTLTNPSILSQAIPTPTSYLTKVQRGDMI